MLDAGQLAAAKLMGERRWRFLKDQPRTGSNNFNGTPEARLIYNIQGAIGEFGAAAFWGLNEPTDFRRDRYAHDIGRRTDVKSIGAIPFELLIPKDRLVESRLYLLALVESADTGDVRIQGFGRGPGSRPPATTWISGVRKVGNIRRPAGRSGPAGPFHNATF